MTNSPQEKSAAMAEQAKQYGPWRYLIGALISGVFAYGFYLMFSAIAETFANTPVTSTNPIAVNISIAVRTLVVGMTALGGGIFGLVGVGLVAYTVQIIVQRANKDVGNRE